MGMFRKSAGYRYLDAFIVANVVELGTGHFCERFLNLQNDPGGRTCSQMNHAARSGCRNFAEGAERLMTSYSTALQLLDVARASLCELRDDFSKWLMMRGHAPWSVHSAEAKRIFALRLDKPDYGDDINRGVCLHVLAQYRKFEPDINSDDSMVRANTLLVLISRTLNMLDRYIKKTGAEFLEGGGFRERMTEARTAARAESGDGGGGPQCPECGARTTLRRTRRENRPFWGCTEYPACRGTVDCAAGPR